MAHETAHADLWQGDQAAPASGTSDAATSQLADTPKPKILPTLGDLASKPAGVDLNTPTLPPPQSSGSSIPAPLRKLIDAGSNGIQVGDWRLKGGFTRGDGKVDPRNLAREERKRDEPPAPPR